MDNKVEFGEGFINWETVNKIEPLSDFSKWDDIPFGTLSDEEYKPFDFFAEPDESDSLYWMQYESSENIIW